MMAAEPRLQVPEAFTEGGMLPLPCLEYIPASFSPGFQGTLQPGQEPVRGRALPGPNPCQAGQAVQPPRGEPAQEGNPQSCGKLAQLSQGSGGLISSMLFSLQLTDYINASFMDGYKQRNAYIGTQGMAEPTRGCSAHDAPMGSTSLPSVSPWPWGTSQEQALPSMSPFSQSVFTLPWVYLFPLVSSKWTKVFPGREQGDPSSSMIAAFSCPHPSSGFAPSAQG